MCFTHFCCLDKFRKSKQFVVGNSLLLFLNSLRLYQVGNTSSCKITEVKRRAWPQLALGWVTILMLKYFRCCSEKYYKNPRATKRGLKYCTCSWGNKKNTMRILPHGRTVEVDHEPLAGVEGYRVSKLYPCIRHNIEAYSK